MNCTVMSQAKSSAISFAVASSEWGNCRAGSEATNRVAWRLRVYYMYVSNGTGRQAYFLWVQHCLHVQREVSMHREDLPAERRRRLGRLHVQHNKSSGSEERKGTLAGGSLTVGKADLAAGK